MKKENFIGNKKTNIFTTKSLILCALFSALIAIGAFIKIPMPLVPFTLQTLFVIMAGLLLGSKLGSVSVLIYIIIGLVGIPVFTKGGGIGYIFQPTFGYLIGFSIGTYVTGLIVEKKKSLSIKWLLIASFTGLMIIYLIGMTYYYFISNYYIKSPIGIKSLILYCFLLTIPGDIISCFIGVLLCQRLIPILKNERIV